MSKCKNTYNAFDLYSKTDEKKSDEKIQKEIDNGREIMKFNHNKKVTDDYMFKPIDNELLVKEEELIKKNIQETMQICFNRNCDNPRCKNICIIYTNKKVGSTSLWGSINLYLSEHFKTFHIHSQGELERFGLYSLSVNQIIELLNKYNKNIYIIDIYRPIFDICVSNYFNELYVHFQREFRENSDFNNKQTIITRFLQLFLMFYNKHNVDYFTSVYNINKTFDSFDFDNKYLYYERENIKYIKLRLCDSEIWDEILSKIFGYKFKIVKYNETEKKHIGELYNYFKENMYISPAYYDLLVNNSDFKFYYTPVEQEEYMIKLKDKIKDVECGFNPFELLFYKMIIEKNEAVQTYAHISTNSNQPICFNCICNNCIQYRNQLITSLNTNTNTNAISNTNVNSNANNNSNVNSNANSIVPIKRNIKRNKILMYYN
jgi:hypothetical protein